MITIGYTLTNNGTVVIRTYLCDTLQEFLGLTGMRFGDRAMIKGRDFEYVYNGVAWRKGNLFNA